MLNSTLTGAQSFTSYCPCCCEFTVTQTFSPLRAFLSHPLQTNPISEKLRYLPRRFSLQFVLQQHSWFSIAATAAHLFTLHFCI